MTKILPRRAPFDSLGGMAMGGKNSRVLVPTVIALLAAGTFALDARTQGGVVVWILYIIPLMLAGYGRRPWLIFPLALILSALIAGGYFLTPTAVAPHAVLINRLLGIMVLWALAGIKFASQQTKARLRESEMRWQTLFKILPAGVTIVGRDLKYLEMNPASESMLGLAAETGRRENAANRSYVRPDGSEMPVAEWPSACSIREQRAILDSEVGLVREDGVIAWLSVSAAPLPGDRAAVVTLDISKRKLAERALAESEERYRRLFNEMTEGFAVIEIIPGESGKGGECVCLEINPALERLIGRRGEEVAGMPLSKLWPDMPEVGDEWTARFVRLASDGIPLHFEQFFAAGRYHFEVNAYLTAPRRIAFTMLDITDRKRIEKGLADSELRFRSAMQFSAIGMAIVSSNGQFLEVNPALCVILGYGKDELLAADFQSITHAEDLAKDLTNVERLLKGELETYEMEKRYRHRDGHFIWTQLNVSLVRSPDGKGNYFVSQIQDITSRKMVLQALADSERRFRSALQYSGIGMALMSAAGRWLEVNPAACAMLGYSREQLLARDFQSITHSEDLGQCLREIGRLLRGETNTFDMLERLHHHDNHYIWVQLNVSLVQKNTGEESYFVVQIQDITQRKQAEDELFKSREMLQMILDNIPARVFWKDRESRFLGGNLLFARDMGLETPRDLIGKTDYDMAVRGNATIYRADDREVMETNKAKLNYEEEQIRPDGAISHLRTNKVPLHDAAGRVIGILGTYEDITDHKALEIQFRQAQKMEAVGRLAGGIAHDFNNLITIISGYSDIILNELSPGDPCGDSVLEIKKASERAASLTRQLLAFSRKQVLTPDILDLNEVVQECETMFRRLLGEDIELKTVLTDQLGPVRTDGCQLEQVLLNLVVNSRDAMPRGGTVIIRTEKIELGDVFCQRHHGVKPGPYVVLVVSDTGEGMDEATKTQIFEPFFTTKQQGTGLGLAMVFGFIRQSGGHIEVSSEPGSGTTFRIYLPEAVAPEATPAKPREVTRDVHPGNETILLVEDQNDVRTLARHLLESRGYAVLEAANGMQALGVLEACGTPIHLLLSDVVMPGMGGRELAEKVVALRPEIKVLFVSGYTDDAVMRQGISASQTNFLQKPFTGETLHNKVRKVLAG